MRKKEHIELRVAQIISTDKRQQILNVILDCQEPFTVSNIHQKLKMRKVEIKHTAVLNVIKTLHYAGFLSENVEQKNRGKGGRPKNFYKVMPGMLSNR